MLQPPRPCVCVRARVHLGGVLHGVHARCLCDRAVLSYRGLIIAPVIKTSFMSGEGNEEKEGRVSGALDLNMGGRVCGNI